jgi:hypothetical protein
MSVLMLQGLYEWMYNAGINSVIEIASKISGVTGSCAVLLVMLGIYIIVSLVVLIGKLFKKKDSFDFQCVWRPSHRLPHSPYGFFLNLNCTSANGVIYLSETISVTPQVWLPGGCHILPYLRLPADRPGGASLPIPGIALLYTQQVHNLSLTYKQFPAMPYEHI